MLTSIAALSLSDQVEKFGAYAGFAAVVGLAVLSLLYFASAREVKRLREWADRAPERVADLEARIGDLARQRAVIPGPVAKGPAAKPGSKPATAAAAGKPAAKGKTAAATTIAANGDAKDAAKPPAEAAAEGEAPAEDGAPAVFDVVEQAPGDLTEIKKPAGSAPVSDETIVSPGAGRALRQTKPSARPRSQPPVRPSTARLMESARATSAQRMTGGGPPGAAPPTGAPGEGRDKKKIALICGAVAAAIVALVLVTGVLGGGGDDPQQASTNKIVTTRTDTTTSSSTIDRSTTEVAVLNGTTFAGLAKGVADKVSNGGFKRGEVRNALDATRAATIVEYTPGNKAAALEVARTIDVGTDAVVAAQAGTQALAPSAQVIVTVGADQNPTTTG
jgi:hypothetical protein